MPLLQWAMVVVSVNTLLTVANSSFNFLIYLSFCGGRARGRRRRRRWRRRWREEEGGAGAQEHADDHHNNGRGESDGDQGCVAALFFR